MSSLVFLFVLSFVDDSLNLGRKERPGNRLFGSVGDDVWRPIGTAGTTAVASWLILREGRLVLNRLTPLKLLLRLIFLGFDIFKFTVIIV